MLSSTRSHPQSGNMLVYILGAIFLMGLLVVLVKGSSNPGGGIDSEAAMIKATEAQRYAAEVERAVNLVMRNGHSESDIRFSHANAASAYQQTMDTPLTRQVFHPSGGGARFREPPQNVNDGTPWQFFSNTHINGLGTNDSAARKAELIMVLPNVNASFCSAINNANNQNLDIAAGTQDPSANGCIYAPGSEFAGSFISGNGANVLDEDTFTHNPPTQACVRCDDGTLHFYHVLMPR